MKNKPGFIPKTTEILPTEYREIFEGWTAIFKINTGEEYHIQINADYFNPKRGKNVSVLKQYPTHRTEIAQEPFATIKAAVLFLARVISAKKRESMQKAAS